MLLINGAFYFPPNLFTTLSPPHNQIIYSRMSRWNNHSQQEQQIDFDSLLSSKSTILSLLSLDNFVEQVKNRSSKFTQKIIQEKYRPLLLQLIDLALTPQLYMATHNCTIDKSITHAAIQILSNLSQEFIEQIFDKQVEEEDSVIQTEKEYPILNHLFKILSSSSAEETALAYLNKIVTPFIYQRSQEMIKIVNSQYIHPLLNYFWNQSIAEIVNKVIEAQSQKDFFEKEKVQLIRNVCKCMQIETNEEKLERNMQSFGEFMQSLVQKHQDKYDKSKYANLLRIVLEDNNVFQFLFHQFKSHPNNRAIRVQILHCIDAYLRIHLPTKINSKISDSNQPTPDGYKVNDAFLNSLRGWLGSHQVQDFISQSRHQLLNYYKVVKSALLVDSSLLPLLNSQFLTSTLKAMQKDPNNNILHNFQREVLLYGIKESEQVHRLLQEELQINQLLSSKFSDKNSKDCYQNQLFLISEAVRQKSSKGSINLKGSEGWSVLSERMQGKRLFYSALIGGNARESDDDRWDSIQNQNEMILKSLSQKDVQVQKQTIQQTLEVLDQPKHKIMIHISSGLQDLGGTEVLSEDDDDDAFNNIQDDQQNKHFFDDCQLPLDSDKDQDGVDDSPIVIRIDSIQDGSLGGSSKGSLRVSGGSLKKSNEGEGERGKNLDIVLEDPAIEHTTEIILEDSSIIQQTTIDPNGKVQKQQFLKVENIVQVHKQKILPSPIKFCREQVQSSLLCKYQITLQKLVPFKEQISISLLCKYNLKMI